VRPLSASRILDVWEAGQALGLPGRAVAILAAALPERAPGELAALPVGDCDAALLALHEQTFGPMAEGLASCPACAEQVEVSVDLRQLRVPAPEEQGPGPWELQWEGLVLTFRLPCNADLAAAARAPDAATARRVIARRCVLDARALDALHAPDAGEEAIPFAAVPEEALAALADRMAALDPQADLELELRCPACGHGWDAVFDVAGFVWARLSAAARRLAGDVAQLARAYGWREADILAMSAWRRQLYLEWSGV
jgi:hypothetical protein